MSRKTANILVSIALAMVLGLHWSVLQTVAWTSMAIQFSRTDTLKDAFVKTFDGSRPCKICMAVQEGRSAQKEKQNVNDPTPKLDFFLVHNAHIIVAPRVELPTLTSADPVTVAAPSPPTPPPRSLVG